MEFKETFISKLYWENTVVGNLSIAIYKVNNSMSVIPPSGANENIQILCYEYNGERRYIYNAYLPHLLFLTDFGITDIVFNTSERHVPRPVNNIIKPGDIAEYEGRSVKVLEVDSFEWNFYGEDMQYGEKKFYHDFHVNCSFPLKKREMKLNGILNNGDI